MAKKRLLLVDDVELVLQLERSFLSRSSFEIHLARTGQEALNKTRSMRPDLVLLDLNLPDMSGDSVCRIIKGDPETARTVVVMISSGRSAEDRSRLEACRCEAAILKPLTKEELCRVVETQLGIAQRLYRRVDTNLGCQFSQAQRVCSSSIHSLGQGGAFVELAGCMPRVGVRGGLEFSLPDWDRLIRTAVRICWTGVKGTGGPRGAGLEFLDIRSEDRLAVGRFVDLELSIRGSGPVLLEEAMTRRG